MSQNGSTWLIPNRFLKEEYAGRHQCVKVFFTAASLAVLGSTVLAMIFFLVDRERLSPANCSPGHNGKMVCDSFGLMSFIGSVCFFTIWTPLGFLMFARYLPLRLQQYQFGQSIWTRIFIAVPILVGLAIFSFGVILITRSHTDWVYWTVAYTALVIVRSLCDFIRGNILQTNTNLWESEQTGRHARPLPLRCHSGVSFGRARIRALPARV